jgi:hypothetical protein
MESFFGGNPREYSSVFHWFINHIFCTFYNKISGSSLEMWVDQVDEFRHIICDRISHPPTQIELEIDPTLAEEETLGISFDDFRCWGFIDATDFRTTRTGSGPQPDGSRRAYAYELQREFYSRYFRAHGIKYLSVLLPNGLTGAVFGASLSTNDNGMINLSGISDYLLQLLNPMHSHGLFPSLFGDSIMQLTPVIQSYSRIQNGRNTVWRKRMSSARMCIELDYGLLFNNFRIMIREESHQNLNHGILNFRLGIVCFLLKNCYICLNGSTTNTMFNTTPPSIQEYLPLDEEIIGHVPIGIPEEYNYG